MTNCIANLVKPRAALLLAATLVSAASSHAQDPSRALILTAYVNAAGGSDLTDGKYAAAIAQINQQTRSFEYRGAATHTNLCVAHVALRELAAARTECNAAVAAEQAERSGLAPWTSDAYRHANQELALAYSNRAVLCQVAADRACAERDMADAAKLAPEAPFVQRNRAAMALWQSRQANAP
jgi:hypothetical protein